MEVLIVVFFQRISIISGIFLFLSCAPEFNNPYDPDGDKPLPLEPTDISITSPERGTVYITFFYEYASNSKIRIKRDQTDIAILTSGTEFYDYWPFSEDTSMRYKLTGFNDFGSTNAPKIYFYYIIPPRIKILSKVEDTVYTGNMSLSGTVWDSSDIDVFTINNDAVPLTPYGADTLFYNWDYTLILDNGDNPISIYAKDKSSFDSDTTIELSVYYSEPEIIIDQLQIQGIRQ